MEFAPWRSLREAAREWSSDKVPRLSAALAYYTMLSIAPLLIVTLKITGLLLGAEAARGQIQSYVAGNVGAQGAKAIEEMIANAGDDGAGVMAASISILILLFSASGVFGELQDSLNTIWKVRRAPGLGIKTMIKDRFWSMTLVLGVGFLLLVSLVISALLAAATDYFRSDDTAIALWEIAHAVVSIGVVALLFALMFKMLPDADIEWRDVWLGALVTSILFTAGKLVLGWYLGRGATTSVYGAAGSLVALLIWVYYAAQIFFFGAEMTKVEAHRRHKVSPSKHALPAPASPGRARLSVARPARGSPGRGA